MRPPPYDPVKDFAPAATPKDMIARLNADVVRVLSTPETKALMIKFGAESAPSTR